MPALKKSTKTYLLLALAGFVVLLLVTRPQQGPELRELATARVLATVVGLHDLVPAEIVSGRLEPARKALLHFELSGQVHERRVEPGQVVVAGESLLSLADGDYRDALAEAEAQLQQVTLDIDRDRILLQLARQNYALRKNDLERLEQLGADSLVSRSRLDETRIQLIQLEAEVAQLRASVGSAQSRLALREAARNRAARNLERTQLLAPFAGIVNSVAVQAGDYVVPTQAVVTLIDVSALDIYVEVRGDVAQSLQQGQAVAVGLDGLALAGELVALQIDPDPVTFTHALRIRVAGDSARPGQLAQVNLPLQALSKVTAVPSTAILHDDGRTFVFRLAGSGTLEKTEVLLGKRVDQLQVVRQGINASDRVVVRGVAALSHGQKVDAGPVTAAVSANQPVAAGRQ